MHPIVSRLADLIAEHRWQAAFADAIDRVAAQRLDEFARIGNVADYLRFLDDMVGWAPREAGDSRLVHDKLVAFYFVLDQPPLRALQSAIEPGNSSHPLTPLSRWIVDFAAAWGRYLDQPESAAHVDSFRSNPAFHWDDYMAPPSGYLTFNQFFARHVKPGRRPVAALTDDRVIVSPADAVFIGQWPIAGDSTIVAKGLRWSIEELLQGSAHASRFAGGLFMHCALRTFDYHRFHSPCAGTVLEARIIQGQAFLDVDVVEASDEPGQPARRKLHAVEGTGYQFVQSRGLLVIDSPIGRVACLAIGMAQVSSVVLTAEPGAALRKGEELGYFQFGGSDFVMVFEAGSGVALECEREQHYRQGVRIGQAGGELIKASG